MSGEMDYGPIEYGAAVDGLRLIESPARRATSHKSAPLSTVQHLALEGYATIYGEAHPHKGFVDYLARGCFAGATRPEANVAFLVEHDRSRVLGTKFRGSLEIGEDALGVAFRLRVPDTIDGRKIAAEVKAGTWRMSVGFNPVEAEWTTIHGERCRVVRKADLVEVSAVERPALARTWVRVVDLRTAPPFGAMLASGKMAAEAREALTKRLASESQQAAARYDAALRKLKARLE